MYTIQQKSNKFSEVTSNLRLLINTPIRATAATNVKNLSLCAVQCQPTLLHHSPSIGSSVCEAGSTENQRSADTSC